MVDKTKQDDRDAAQEISQSRTNATSGEPDPVTETHSKAKAHDLTTHNHVVNEDSDGTLGSSIAGGIINTGEANAKLASYNSTDKKKEKEKDDLRRLIHMLETQIEELKEEVANIRKQMKVLGEQIVTKEGLLETLREGRKLTEAQERLAEKYRDKDGNINQDALVHDIYNDKDELQELKERADAIDSKIEEKTNIVNSLKIEKQEQMNPEERKALFGETSNSVIDTEIIKEKSAGNEEYATFLEEGLRGDDNLLTYDSPDATSNTSVASIVSQTTIDAKSIKTSYNNAASGEDNNTLPENGIIKKIDNVRDFTV